jgi:hypothetical protein
MIRENYVMRRLIIFSSPNMIGVIKSRRMRLAVYVARMGERKGAYKF